MKWERSQVQIHKYHKGDFGSLAKLDQSIVSQIALDKKPSSYYGNVIIIPKGNRDEVVFIDDRDDIIY